MKSNSKFLIAIAFLIVIVAGFFLLRSSFESSASLPIEAAEPSAPQQGFSVVPPSAELLIRPHSPILGGFSAKVTIVEFLDPECEACREMYPHVKKVLKEFGRDVRLVVRYMPFHPNSMLAANVLEGAREKGKYWEALALLFARQPDWAAHGNPRPELIPEVLKPLGLKMEEIMIQAEAGKFSDTIKQDQADGEKIGVRATPTFYINGRMLDEMGYEPLRAAVAGQLESAANN